MCAHCISQLHLHQFCPICGEKCTTDYYKCIQDHRQHTACSGFGSEKGCAHCGGIRLKGVYSDESMPELHEPNYNENYTKRAKFTFNDHEEKMLIKLAMLVSEKRDQTTMSNFPLKKAIDSNDLQKIVELALSGKLRSLRIGKKTLFHYCVTESKFHYAELFLRFGSDVNQLRSDGRSVLSDTVVVGNERMISYALSSGCNTRLMDEHGLTAFHFAAKSRLKNPIQILFENDPLVKPRITDFTGYTMILWAVESERIDNLKFLLTKSTARDTNCRDNKGKTALHWASHLAKASFCRELLRFDRALIDMVDGEGNSAFMLAASTGDIETLSVLVQFNPNLWLVNKNGKMAIDECDDYPNAKTYIDFIQRLQKQKSKQSITPKRRLIKRDITNGKEALEIPVYNEVDDELSPSKFTYITRSRPRNAAFTIEQQITGNIACICSGSCQTCKCAESSFRCRYKNQRLDLNAISDYEHQLIQECNDMCSCDLDVCQVIHFCGEAFKNYFII